MKGLTVTAALVTAGTGLIWAIQGDTIYSLLAMIITAIYLTNYCVVSAIEKKEKE